MWPAAICFCYELHVPVATGRARIQLGLFKVHSRVPFFLDFSDEEKMNRNIVGLI